MIDRKPLIEWAKAFVGDPASFERRAEVMAEFLDEEGLDEHSRVLEVGCGALNLAAELAYECEYVGIEPNGFLIEAGLTVWPELEQQITVLYRDDFLAAGHRPFDLVIAHSILSHAADWQLEQCLANVRKVVDEGAVFLASLRLNQYDKGERRWVYPDVSYFRLETVQTLGYHIGWQVERVPEYRERMTRECPQDLHDWLRLRAVPSASDWNTVRVDEEARQREEREILEIAEAEYRRRQSERLIALGEQA